MTQYDLYFPDAHSSGADALAGPFWLLATLLGLAVTWKWARRLFPGDTYLELVGHTIVLAWSSLVAISTVLGGLGCLTATALLLCVLVPSLLAFVAMHLSKLVSISRAAFLRSRKHFVSEAGQVSKEGECHGSETGLASVTSQPGRDPLDRAEKCWLLLWAAVLAYWIAHVLTKGLGQFPSDFDTLAYHLPLVDHWLQSASLYATGCCRWMNPGNNELLALWAVAPFSGDFFASLINLPAAILLACATVSLATQLGLTRPLAHLSGMALVCNYVVFRQLVAAENDVAAAACFFAALSYVFRYVKQPALATLMLGAASLGLLAGIKYYATGYALLALVVWVLLSAQTNGWRSSVRVLAVGVAGMVALSGFWYVRNCVMTGSPLYPREFFKHPDLLCQLYPEIVRTSFLGNRRPELLPLYVKAIWQKSGPMHLVGFLFIPLSLSWLLASRVWYQFFKKEPGLAGPRLSLAFLLVGSGILLAMTPMTVEDRAGTLNQIRWQYCPVRYGLCFLSTATLSAMFLLQDLVFGRHVPTKAAAGANSSPWYRYCLTGLCWTICLALVGTIVFQLIRTNQFLQMQWCDNLLIAMNLVLMGMSVLLLMTMWPGLRFWLIFLFLAAALPASAWACAFLSDRWHKGFVSYYEAMQDFPALPRSARHDSEQLTILVLQPRCYPFFGSQRQNRVLQPVYVPSAEWLAECLRDRNVNVVVAQWDRLSPGMKRRFRDFNECLAQNPNMARRVGKAREPGVFEVLRPLE